VIGRGGGPTRRVTLELERAAPSTLSLSELYRSRLSLSGPMFLLFLFLLLLLCCGIYRDGYGSELEETITLLQ